MGHPGEVNNITLWKGLIEPYLMVGPLRKATSMFCWCIKDWDTPVRCLTTFGCLGFFFFQSEEYRIGTSLVILHGETLGRSFCFLEKCNGCPPCLSHPSIIMLTCVLFLSLPLPRCLLYFPVFVATFLGSLLICLWTCWYHTLFTWISLYYSCLVYVYCF